MMVREFRSHMTVLAFGYGLSALAVTGVLGPYPTFSGKPGVERAIVLFLLPVTASVIWGLLRSLHRSPPPVRENGSSDAAIRAIQFWVIAFLIGVHTLMVGVLVGIQWIQPWATRGVVVLLGVVVAIVGNLLPRTRPNMAVGIRTERTLNDRQLWMNTHRMTGYTVVILGAITVYAGLFLDRPRAAAIPGISFLVSLLWVGGFYWKASHASNQRH